MQPIPAALKKRFRSASRAWLFGIVTLCVAAFTTPKTSSAQQDSLPPGTNLRVYLLTFGFGDEVWERFGHNAIWIQDRTAHTDVTYNWGMFDFQQPHFIRRFLSGRTSYWMQPISLEPMLQEYVARNRSVLAQELDLSPAQSLDLQHFVEWNARPENKFYRYDYFRDNCSTRLRDALDRSLGGQIHAATGGTPSGATFRSHTARLMTGDIPIYTGIQLALGHRADRPISVWEEMFLPVKMSERMRAIRLKDGSGNSFPLVKSEMKLYTPDRGPEPSTPPSYFPYYVAAGLLLAVFVVYMVRAAENGFRPAAFAAIALTWVWTLLSGFFGLVVLLAWAITEHAFMGKNENLLQFNPLALALVVLFPLSLFAGRASRSALRIALVIAALSLLGFVGQGISALDQKNGEIIALALPLNLVVAWTLHRLGAYRRTSRSSSADL